MGSRSATSEQHRSPSGPPDVDDQDGPTPEVPESVAGYDLEERAETAIEWVGQNGGVPPIHIDRDGYETTVRARSDGTRRHGHRWYVTVYWDDGNERAQQTIASRRLTLDEPDDGFSRNRDAALESALEWMKENPADDATDQDDTMSDDTSTYDPIAEWSDGQQSLDGGPAAGQATFDAPPDTSDPEIESIDEVNEGGLMADERESTGDPTTAEQESLEVGAEARRDPEQDGLGESIPDDAGTDEPEDEDRTHDAVDGEEIRFGSMAVANSFRDDNAEHLGPSDDRRTKTVSLASDAPDHVVDEAVRISESEKAEDAQRFGQTELTDHEREQLEDRGSWKPHRHLFHAQSAKAILQGHGIDDWLSFYDPELSTDEHRSHADEWKQQEVGDRLDVAEEQQQARMAKQAEKVHGEMCNNAEDACADGEQPACEALLEQCGYDEDDIAELLEAVEGLDEDPEDVFAVSDDVDSPDLEAESRSFEAWARDAMPEPPEEPTDEELARIAPTPDPDDVGRDRLPGPALAALKKAWSGYKLARTEARDAQDDAEHYAEVINGIRAVHGQNPLEFDDLEGFEGGEILPDDPNETYPTADGEMTMEEAGALGRLGSSLQSTFDSYTGGDCPGGECYDPMAEF